MVAEFKPCVIHKIQSVESGRIGMVDGILFFCLVSVIQEIELILSFHNILGGCYHSQVVHPYV